MIVRDIEERDLPALKLLIAEAFGEGWNLERYARNDELTQALLGTYLSIFMEPGTFGRIAEIDGDVVGVVVCSAKGDSAKFGQLHKNIMPNSLTLLTAEESERADIVEHISVSFQTIMQLIENKVDIYDGALELIIVTERAQGRKIGKTLWNLAADYFNSQNVKSIYLITDSRCNVGFYDYNGFSKVDAKVATYNYTIGQKMNEIFLYDYQF